MAFVRRIGKNYHLVHNVRRGGKVKQLHLASLGDRPRITDEVVRSVARHHPFLNVNWSRLREQVNSRVELFDIRSEYLRKLQSSIVSLNLDLADLAPPLLALGQAPDVTHEMVTHLRLLQSTVEVKLGQFEQARETNVLTQRRFR
jgi:hypothetical protein